MRVGEDGWLIVEESGYPEVKRVPTVRTMDLEVPKPLGVVWHWTAGKGGTPSFAPNLAESIRNYKQSVDRPASWHFLLAKDGRIFQSVPTKRGAWHVGKPGRVAGHKTTNVNRCTVGVELENAGWLEKVGKEFYCWPFWANPDEPPGIRAPDEHCRITDDRVVIHKGYYDGFPEAQVLAAARLLSALTIAFDLTRETSSYGHALFDPIRKTDPGPLWQEVALPRVLDLVFGAQ